MAGTIVKTLYQVVIITPIFTAEKITRREIKLASRRVPSKPIMSDSKDYAFFVLRNQDLEITFCAGKANTGRRIYQNRSIELSARSTRRW